MNTLKSRTLTDLSHEIELLRLHVGGNEKVLAMATHFRDLLIHQTERVVEATHRLNTVRKGETRSWELFHRQPEMMPQVCRRSLEWRCLKRLHAEHGRLEDIERLAACLLQSIRADHQVLHL